MVDISYKIVCDANSMCFMMWQDSPTMSHMRKSRPHGCFYHDSPQRHGDTKSAPSKRSKVHRQWLETPARLQKNQVVANHFIDVHRLMTLILSGQVTKFPHSHACLNFQVLNFQVSERTPTCSRGPLKKEGIGVALLLKGVTKTPSCMRKVLGNSPAVLFVALE